MRRIGSVIRDSVLGQNMIGFSVVCVIVTMLAGYYMPEAAQRLLKELEHDRPFTQK